MSEILQSIGSSGWWFSTVIVAIISNIIANYIYDALKMKMAGHWGSVLVLGLHIAFSALFIASIFTLPIPTVRAVYLALGVALASALGLFETYQIPWLSLARVVPVVAVFSLTLFEADFSRALAERDLIWFGQQYFYCTLMSTAISMIMYLIFYRRHLRKRRGLGN